MQLIVGLGNPGAKYAPTRHNVGAWFVEALAHQYKQSWQLASKFHSRVAQIHFAEEVIKLAVPTTYMNLSGQAVGALAHFYKITPAEILIIHDELDLPAGVIRLKHGGGHGGHNGLRSIIEHLHASAFYRLRIGIGRPPHGANVADFVLSKPNPEEKTTLDEAITQTLAHMDLIFANNISKAMQILHS